MHVVSSPIRRAGVLPVRARSAVRAAALLLTLTFASACHTEDDAKAVSTQLTATATALSGYYTAIQTEIVDTDQLNTLEAEIGGAAYDSAARAAVLDNAAELQKRIDLANQIATVGASLNSLAGSTGAADASTAASKLLSATAAIGPLSGPLSAPVQAGLAGSAQDIVAAIQGRKIRSAASHLADFLHKLDAQFTAEEPAYESITQQYVDLSSELADWFVDKGQTDPAAFASALTKVALAPYGLTAKLDAATQAKLAASAKDFVKLKVGDLKTAQASAGKAMEDALADIAMRTDDLAANKPLPAGLNAPWLTTVNQWAATLASK